MKCIFVCACLAHEILDNKLKILEQLEQAAQCPIEGAGVGGGGRGILLGRAEQTTSLCLP